MSKRDQHVVPRDGGWAVRGAGAARDTSRHRTQTAAVSRARQLAGRQGTELVIHRPNGRIRAKDSGGPDPYPPRG